MSKDSIPKFRVRRSAIHRDLRTPKYRARTVQSKKVYDRKGYRGFPSKEEYEAYYSGPLPQWEIDAMKQYARENDDDSK